MKHIPTFDSFINESLRSGQNTKVQFLNQKKGETSIIADWGSDGYPKVK